MSISGFLKEYPQLEQVVQEQLKEHYNELMGQDPLPEMEQLLFEVGVKMDQTRDAIMEDFAALFPEDKIEKLVDFLFDTLNP